MYRTPKSLFVLRRIFENGVLLSPRKVNNLDIFRNYTDNTQVTIGNVTKKTTPPKKPQFVPHKYLSVEEMSQTTLRHLMWMLQKDLLGQDIFLIGRPGSTRRRLAMIFLEMTNREVEYISLSRDTTEADLKQRREISGGTARYFDQNAVRAATEGRVLILEGIEKAERNVLPVLNNLLENREMHLEDGRFLIPASRYDKLLKEHRKEDLDLWNLVRVSDDFRVIALGLPVPKYVGNSLDPPLRSRFQARNILPNTFQDQLSTLKKLAPNANPAKLSQLLSASYALLSDESVSLGLPDFPADNIPKLGEILRNCPNVEVSELLDRLYPYRSFLNREGRDAVEHILETFNVENVKDDSSKNKIDAIKIAAEEGMAECVVRYKSSSDKLKVSCGSNVNEILLKYIPTNYQDKLISQLLLSHSVSDFCLIGPKGCGKSVTLLRLAQLLNYEVEPIVLYQDITSRDLVQQRNTLPNGDTIWQNSPLVQAALKGKIAILDGIDRVHPSTLSVIHRLVQDREIQLYNGNRLLRHDRYDEIKEKHKLSDADMVNSGTLRIHPSFRIAALAESSKQGNVTNKWLSPEMLSLFLFHEMRPLSYEEESHIIQSLLGKIDDKMVKILKFASYLRTSEDPTLNSLSSSFSTRQLLRIAKRMANYPFDSTYESVQRACLARFLPPIAKQALDNALLQQGFDLDSAEEASDIKCRVGNNTVRIGNTEVSRSATSAKTKVPDILFYDVPQHLALLEWLLQDFVLGEHLLLVGNQGVGKNKIADRLLQLLNRPREYIQLHRDTTVQTLTLQATVKDGVVSYEDSPLVQAVKCGHVLVVDEADKAPTHVTCVLKTLVERGEMALSDGRKIGPFRSEKTDENIIPLHPDFRMIVLANRPGFPFLGNDFFGALGDLFSCHAVDNPSPESETALLKQYGPDVPESTILKLVRAFGELRNMADKGLVQYPYSTREVVNIVKHLQKFPDEGLTTVVNNVFDFDKHSSNVLETLFPVLEKHGIPINTNINNVHLSKEYSLPPIRKYGQWHFNKLRDNNSNVAVEISNLKTSSIRDLDIKESKFEIIEERATLFSEQQSHWLLPMSNNAVVTGLAVTIGGSDRKDLIHVLTLNPFRLYTATENSSKVKIINLEAYIPRLRHGLRYKFTITPLSGLFNDCLVLHEENLGVLMLIDFIKGTLRKLETSSISEKMIQIFKKTDFENSNSGYRLNSQLSNSNRIVLHGIRRGDFRILDFNTMSVFSMELPARINSVQTTSDCKWLLQDVENKKYVFEKNKAEDPTPSVLVPITETIDEELNLGFLIGSSQIDLDKSVVSKMIGSKIDAPNRLLLTDECFATVAVGFPELDSSANDLYSWFRSDSRRRSQGLLGKSLMLENSAQIATVIDVSLAPHEIRRSAVAILGYLEVVDLKNLTVRYIPIPEGPQKSWYLDANELGVYSAEVSDEGLVTADRTGCLRFWETGFLQLQRSLDDWKKLVGKERESLQLTIERDSGKDVSRPKHGKVDPDNKPHVGGNTWAGGTGGRDTAGLGGKGGPYRLDAGHDVRQISDREKEDVPEEVKKAAREMGRKAFRKRLKEIQMSEYDHEMYQRYAFAVQKQVEALRIVIDNIQAKAKERQWTRHQTSGDLDDLKLIEGITGEKTIYRRREEKPPEPGTPQTKPKRLKFVVDVSGSMYRFNGYDGRLERMMEATILVMEAFKGYESKIQYDIIGHSGEAYNIVFVEASSPPNNNKQRLEVIKTMHAHSQFCLSGDHTLPSTIHAIESLAKEDCDEAIVVVLSDANLERYGIRPQRFGQILTSNPDVNAYAIFIGSLGDQAERLAATLPAGRAFVCLDLTEIPQIIQQIFTSSMLSSS